MASFSDAAIRCPSNCHNNLTDDACLFIDVVVDGKTWVKRTEQLTKESAVVTGWKHSSEFIFHLRRATVTSNLHVHHDVCWPLFHIFDRVPSTRLTVMTECPNCSSQQLQVGLLIWLAYTEQREGQGMESSKFKRGLMLRLSLPCHEYRGKSMSEAGAIWRPRNFDAPVN